VRRKNAKRLELKDAQVITKIPVLPISYGDAEAAACRDYRCGRAPRVARRAWALPIILGPDRRKVHLKVKSNWDLKTIYDVIGKNSRKQRMRINGSSAEIITTRG